MPVHHPAAAGVLDYVQKKDIDELDIMTFSSDPSSHVRSTDKVKFKTLGDQFGDYHIDIGRSLGIERVEVDYQLEQHTVLQRTFFLSNFFVDAELINQQLLRTNTLHHQFLKNKFLLLGLTTRAEIVARGLKQDGSEIGAESFTYANTTARENAENLTKADIGKLALQTSFDNQNNSYWELLSLSPKPKWVRVQNPGAREQLISSVMAFKPALFFIDERDVDGQYSGGTYEEDGITLHPLLNCTGNDFSGQFQQRPWQYTRRKGFNFMSTPVIGAEIDFSGLPYNGFSPPPYQTQKIPLFSFVDGFEKMNSLGFDTYSDFYSEGIYKFNGTSLSDLDTFPIHLYDIGSLAAIVISGETSIFRLQSVNPRVWGVAEGLGELAIPARVTVDQNGHPLIAPGASYFITSEPPYVVYNEPLGSVLTLRKGLGISLYGS